MSGNTERAVAMIVIVPLGNAYTPEERCVAAGYDNGDVKLFDLRKMGVRWETNLKNGVRRRLLSWAVITEWFIPGLLR